MKADSDCLGTARFDLRLVALGLSAALARPVADSIVTLADILTVLPADSLAAIILVGALIAILGHALIAELPLSAIAVTSEFALALPTGRAAVLSGVHLTLLTGPGLPATLAPLILIPVHVPIQLLAMFGVGHLERPPSQCGRRARRGSRDGRVLYVVGRKGYAMEGRPGPLSAYRPRRTLGRLPEPAL